MRLSLMLGLIFAGCAQGPSWSPQKNAATQQVHQEVLAQLESEGRTPASPALELGARLSDLNKVKPGKFEIYVFPKLSNQTRKSWDGEDTYLGKPQAFEVSVVAENPCKQFLQRGLFANLKPVQAFAANLAQGDRRCAILEFTDKRLRQLDRARLKRDDVLMTRLFIDDAYHVHATDRVIYETANSVRTVRVVNSDDAGYNAAFTGLSLFPVDLPPKKASYSTGILAESFKSIDGVAVYQVRRHHLKTFSVPQCQGGVVSYNDEYGAKAKIGFCAGLPWPSFSENARFISVTQPLSVGGAR